MRRNLTMLTMTGAGLLTVGSGVSMAAPAAAPVAPPAVQVLAARPQRLLYAVGEPVTGQVTLKNNTKAPADCTVKAWLEWRLGERGKVQEQTVTLAPDETRALPFTFKKLPVLFGYVFKSEVTVAGQEPLRGEDYFQVTDQTWKTAIIAACGAPHKNPGFFAHLRKEYYNVYEVFFWAPDDFLELTPEKSFWYSGQARYPVARTGIEKDWPGDVHGLIDLIRQNHELHGMRAITYAKLTGCGPTGFEMARRHPDWMWQDRGILSVCPDAESLAKWDDRSVKKIPNSWLPVDYNMNDPKVVDIGIKELADSATMFGWDGARWDGNFSVRTETRDLEGKVVDKLTGEQAEARNADNMRRTKAFISKRYPNYVYGYNYIGTTVAQNLLTQPRETAELCRGGGLLMNEYIRGAGDVNHPLHNWRELAETVVDDTQRIKAMGGYMGPILGYQGADGTYAYVFSYAAGAHPYYHNEFGAFLTRYSWFFWDPDLRSLPLPETTVNVAGSVWWDKWVFTRDLDARHRQLIVHLINPPTNPEVGRQKTLPPPQKNVRVLVYPAAQPDWKLATVTRLNVSSQATETHGVAWKETVGEITIPEVALWNIVVLDFVKGGR